MACAVGTLIVNIELLTALLGLRLLVEATACLTLARVSLGSWIKQNSIK